MKLQFGQLSDLLESTADKSLDQARKIAEEEYAKACAWIEEVRHVEKRNPNRVNYRLCDYHYDLQTFLAILDGLPSRAVGYKKRLIEEALKRWGRTGNNDWPASGGNS